MIGTSLAHFEITELIGKGGMGEVYRARDTKLGRDVALKLLPESMARDPERLARFEREARTLASLNHPNVASLYGFEEAGGVRFLVMELVEGEDLAQRLERMPLSIEEAVALGRDLARGLESAHRKGIVHRDLKPANIKFSDDGETKILDFGLARAFSDEDPDEDPTLSPTVTRAMTQAGAVLGTAAYMSPEQAKGLAVDQQSDIFSLGCVLYECIAGQQAFPGDSITEVLASILRSEPDWSALPVATPAALRRVLARCLEKKRADRLRDAGDVEILLRDLEPEPSVEVTSSAGRAWVWPALAGLLALALVGTFLRNGTTNDLDAGSAAVTQISQLTDLPGLQQHPSLSPDGRQLLYTDRDGGDHDIFLQRVGGENPVNLTADSPAEDRQAAFSPDGDRIAFVSDRQGGGIFVMGATGESPRRVSDVGFDPDWSPDGTRLAYTEELVVDPYSRNGLANLWVLDLESGEKQRLDDIDAAGPNWSPSGERIAFWTHLETIQGQRDIWTIAADGGAPTPVLIDIHTDWDPVWSTDGRWLYFLSDRGGHRDLWRIAIDERSGEAQGDPMAVTTGTTGFVQVSPMRSGRLATVAYSRRGAILRAPFDPVAERMTGSPEILHSSSGAFWQLSLSPDGQWLSFGSASSRERLYLMSTDGTVRRKLVDDEYRNRGLEMAPDGRWAVYYSNRDGSYDIWAIRADGTGARNLTASAKDDFNDPNFLPDGRLTSMRMLDDRLEVQTVEFDIPEGGFDAVEGPLSFEGLPGSEGFSGWAPSPDGGYIVGVRTPDYAAAVYSMDDESYEALARDGKPVFLETKAAWLDARRFLFWDLERAGAFVYDLDSGEYRAVPEIPGPSHQEISPDGETLYINHGQEESSVWLLELEGE